jgi:LCCL domain
MAPSLKFTQLFVYVTVTLVTVSVLLVVQVPTTVAGSTLTVACTDTIASLGLTESTQEYHFIHCPGGCSQVAAGYGLNPFSDHSNVCGAAHFAGIIDNTGAGGNITLRYLYTTTSLSPGSQGMFNPYDGVTRVSVNTFGQVAAFGVWEVAAAGVIYDVGCSGENPRQAWTSMYSNDANSIPEPVIGRQIYVRCTACLVQNPAIWGKNVGSQYTADSDFCAMAVHAGYLSNPANGVVAATLLAGADSYTGSTANGLTSASYGAWSSSVRVSKAHVVEDSCPADPDKLVAGQCGCGTPDVDQDADGVADCVDNCIDIPNAEQLDGNSDGIGDACSCILVDTSCNYQPDPPVVTFSDVVIGDDDLAYYRIQMNASAHWDEYVKVLFPESDNDHCDYPSGVVTWAVTRASDNGCTMMYSVDIPVSDFLGKCGFSQTIRNGDSMFFQQTAQILTNRTCEDGRINQLSLSDVELSETRSVSRETQYEIEIVAPTNATAKTGGLEVFGTAFKLDLLGDLTITPDIDTNMPTISGFFVTETQHPYELQDPVFALTGDFNYATFELTGTYCTADNSTRLPCQQTWSYSFQPNQTCPDKAQLEGELVQVTWSVNCSDGFIGECAPSFAVQPEATFTLNSPIYCFSSDYIELTPALEVYQFDQLTANSANFGASTLGTLADNGFSVERVFTIDSQLYAEYTVVAAGTGVTLTATTLKKVSTTTSSRGELVLYETNAAEQVITQATTFVVHDTGFGTDESSDFADYRTRFQFTWLNDTTVLLDSTEDLAQTIALSATSISIFTNVQSLRKAGIDERHPVLSKLNSDQHSKEQEDKHMILFADGHEPRDSRTTVLARLAPASTTNTPAASTASSGFVVSPTVAAAGVALIAVVALVAFAVIRRGRNASSKSAAQHQLPTSSSGVQLTDFSGPVVVQTTMSTVGLEDIAASYDANTQSQH